MAYTKQIWIDSQSPLNAERMNHIEDGIYQNAEDAAKITEDVNKLSEEIQELKEGETVTKTGTVVILDADEGANVHIESDTTEAVKLVHQNKNFITTDQMTTGGDITAAVNADGSVRIKISNTVAGNRYVNFIPRGGLVFLPAGTYAFSTNAGNLLGNGVYIAVGNDADGSVVFTTGANTNTASWKFDIPDGGTNIFVFIYFPGGATVDADVWVQIERIEGVIKWTDFEPGARTETVVTFPVDITAFAGKNIFYTLGGDMLRASTVNATGGGIDEEIIDEKIANAIKFDSSGWGLPVLALTGDTSAMSKDNAVDLAYAYGELSGTASVKWQGSSSLSYEKKNYTIKFDNAFEAKEGWGEQKKYCLKANFIDHSHARNLMCASIWGELVKSAVESDDRRYSLRNGGAVDGFPCIVTLNGEFHGLYTWNIPKDGWMLGMGSGTQECILCANGTAQPNADGFKTLETTLGTAFDVEYITDENNTEWALTSLNRMLSAVINSDGSDLDTLVAQYLDWDSVIDHYIQTVLTGAADCTFKNYLLSTYDGMKWFFTGYDMDSTFGLYWNGKNFILANAAPTFTSYATLHRAMELVKTYKKDALKARYKGLRAGALSEVNITNKLTNYMAGIPSQVLDEDARKWPTIPSTSASNLAQMLNWYRLRVAVCDAEIETL